MGQSFVGDIYVTGSVSAVQRINAPQIAAASEATPENPLVPTIEWINFDPSSTGLQRAASSLAIQSSGSGVVAVWIKVSSGSGSDTDWQKLQAGSSSSPAPSVLGPWNGGAEADTALTPMDYTNFGLGWVATRAGNVTGLSALHGEDPISAGTINFHVTINGSTTVVGVALDTTHQTAFVDGQSVAFVAGDIIGISYSTTSDLSGDGIDIAAAVTVELAS